MLHAGHVLKWSVPCACGVFSGEEFVCDFVWCEHLFFCQAVFIRKNCKMVYFYLVWLYCCVKSGSSFNVVCFCDFICSNIIFIYGYNHLGLLSAQAPIRSSRNISFLHTVCIVCVVKVCLCKCFSLNVLFSATNKQWMEKYSNNNFIIL